MTNTPQDILRQYFGYPDFRPGQRTIIDAILKGRDALAIMPTGAGKSICYQVPAMLLNGITIVISPLISLMQDQVQALNDAGIHAAYINSTLTEGQMNRALSLARMGAFKIIYVAPERLMTYSFLDFAKSVPISMVTVDEAHCISQWGQDFRPSYLKIVDFIEELGQSPIVTAFTATATDEVKEDIVNILRLRQPTICVTGFDRPNLYFEVESVRKKDAYVLDYIRNHPDDSGIIYCATRKNVDSLFELLFKSGVSVARYHAGMGTEDRKKSQDDFVYDRTPVIVATNAFGMGIDKSNVRFVIHYNMPQSMENYYQEAGRAGRDGDDASCILLFSAQDLVIDRMLLANKDFSNVDPMEEDKIRARDQLRLRQMENYCRSTSCLRNYILEYFGEKQEKPCGNCGVCQRDFDENDLTFEAKWVINCIAEAKGRFGINIITGTLIGANRARLSEIGATGWKSYNKLSNTSEALLKLLIAQMIKDGYLILTQDRYSVLKIGPHAMDLKDDSIRIIIRTEKKVYQSSDFDEDQSTDTAFSKSRYGKTKSTRSKSKRQGATAAFDMGDSSSGASLFTELKKLRTEISKAAGIPPYIVFSDKTLIDMCQKMPMDDDAFLEVSGVGNAKLERYGKQFMDVIRDYVEKRGN